MTFLVFCIFLRILMILLVILTAIAPRDHEKEQATLLLRKQISPWNWLDPPPQNQYKKQHFSHEITAPRHWTKSPTQKSRQNNNTK